VLRADNLTTFMCRLSRNSATSASWKPKGLSRPVTGKLYLYILHAFTRPRVRLPTCMHARAHTHTKICNTYCFPTASTIRECASMLRYTYIARLVANYSFPLSLCLSTSTEPLISLKASRMTGDCTVDLVH
jgi:hypothetical protein